MKPWFWSLSLVLNLGLNLKLTLRGRIVGVTFSFRLSSLRAEKGALSVAEGTPRKPPGV